MTITTHSGNMNRISMARVPCSAALDLKKKVDILSSLNAKDIIPTNRKYDLLSHEYINYEDNKDSYTLKLELFYFIATHTNLDRKYLNYRILHFCLRNNNSSIFFFDWTRMNQNYSTISNLEPCFFLEFVLPFDAYKIKLWIILI
ncbi:hypothetical protein C4D60_Mb06t03700 [Musa balbisiana]|uniref:Uncharacterized protein n=1 Tax=Musa balbisiana TaxID=52838 RepID=A0A4S8ILP5_MUSBA|nr:hypothetical protein C4D60_Mb06t03700 [Musa balbisiana]